MILLCSSSLYTLLCSLFTNSALLEQYMDSSIEINYLLKHSELSTMGRIEDTEKLVLAQIKY